MTTPPYQPGPYGQPNQDPWGQQSGGGHGQYGPRQPEAPQQPAQPQYGGQWGTEQTQQLGPQTGGPTQQFGPSQAGATQQFGPSQAGATQQFGQQPQYGQPQQWPGAGGPQYGGGFQPPEPPKKKTGMIVAIVVVAVLVVAGAGVGIYFATKDKGSNNAGGETTTSEKTTEPSEDETTTTEEEETTTTEEGGGDAIDAQPGDCIKVNVASSTNADVETVDCSTPEAVYKVATREEDSTGSCPNDQYVSYTEEGQLLLCLQLNARDGECLAISDTEDKRAECGSPEATHRVIKVLDGVDDETQCDDSTTDVLTYPQPPLTICLVSPAS